MARFARNIWATNYIAGVYALAAQVNPRITPDRFWMLEVETVHSVQVSIDEKSLDLNSIIDPSDLIAALPK